jgi:hypothetical protein
LESGKLSLEQRQRLVPIVNKLKQVGELSETLLRNLRAMELLEEIDTGQSRQLLQVMAKGEPSAWLTLEANASLRRLAKKGKG